jgi:hypothetical protein
MTVRTGRIVRLGAAAALCGGLLWGSVWGQDDAFPIGPMRMYATRQRLDGRISWYQVRAVSPDGTEAFVSGAALGMRRAEVEGQVPRFLAEPQLLCTLAIAVGGDVAAPGTEVRLVKVSSQLRDGAPSGDTTEEVRATCTL